MFRLNILQGLPVLARSNETCIIADFRHGPEKVPTWIFQEHTFVVPRKKRTQVRFFRVLELKYGTDYDNFFPHCIFNACSFASNRINTVTILALLVV